MARKAIETTKAKAIGPYSLGIAAGDLVFLSGQIAIDGTGKLVAGDIAAQTEQVFANIASILSAEGLTFAHVVKATVFLTDMADFAAMNQVYQKHAVAPYPARSTVAVAGLPLGALVEIEVTAVRH